MLTFTPNLNSDDMEILEATWKKFGITEQERMVMEECSELAAAVNHYHRGKIDKDALAKEIADVYIMLHQLVMMHDLSMEVDDALEQNFTALDLWRR